MYHVALSAKARSDLKSLPDKFRVIVIYELRYLAENPLAGKTLSLEHTGKHSLKVGVYRIIYRLRKNNEVLVVTIGHRAVVYK